MNEAIQPVIAVGAHLKNTIALNAGQEIFISQHIGDLETAQAYHAFTTVIDDFKNLYEIRPTAFACDMHPEYLSTKFAQQQNAEVIPVQHHYAHVLSCMIDNDISSPVLGVSWDGTGFGTDETVWGGEFILVNENSWERIAHLRTFRLPGGEAAIRQPKRTAFGLVYEICSSKLLQIDGLNFMQQFSEREKKVLLQMLKEKINSPITSSAGRLFDAVAALIGLQYEVSFEGQAAMELEFAINVETDACYPFKISEDLPFVIDWQPMITEIIEEVSEKTDEGVIATKFHNTLVEVIVQIATRINETKVALSGGCFQNKYLTERTISRLKEEGFQPYWHQRIPANDGGIAVGQLAAAARFMQKEKSLKRNTNAVKE
jgi:hydrogenase maturation protein HypF